MRIRRLQSSRLRRPTQVPQQAQPADPRYDRYLCPIDDGQASEAAITTRRCLAATFSLMIAHLHFEQQSLYVIGCRTLTDASSTRCDDAHTSTALHPLDHVVHSQQYGASG